RVDSAQEERAERDVRDQAPANGGGHGLPDIVRRGLDRSRLEAPVPLLAFAPVLEDDDRAGGDLADAAERRRGPGHVLERKVGIEGGGVELATEPGEAEQRLQLRSEGEGAVRQVRPEKRLLADAVAGEHEPLPPGVPERDREHPRETLDESGPVLLVEMRDDRRVAGAPHLVALRGELAA